MDLPPHMESLRNDISRYSLASNSVDLACVSSRFQLACAAALKHNISAGIERMSVFIDFFIFLSTWPAEIAIFVGCIFRGAKIRKLHELGKLCVV